MPEAIVGILLFCLAIPWIIFNVVICFDDQMELKQLIAYFTIQILAFLSAIILTARCYV